ncbi:MAG: ATP-binding protein [Desulfobacter sp.]
MNTELYRLDEATITAEYVDALFGELKKFLLLKNPGHCQRVDFLPLRVIEGLGKRLSGDGDLQVHKIACRVVSSKTDKLEPWEVSGSGAVALREDATYGRIKVFCALFPAGIRLAEEDSLNVATFKTDDAASFNIERTLKEHLFGKVNLLFEPERVIMLKVLNHDAVRSRPVVSLMRYALSVFGQAKASKQMISWELAGAYLYELNMIPDFELNEAHCGVQLARNAACSLILLDGEKTLNANLNLLAEKQGMVDEALRRELTVYLSDCNTLKAEEWLPPICHNEAVRNKLSFDAWKFSDPTTGVSVELNPLQDPKKPEKVTAGINLKNGILVNDGKSAITVKWTLKPADAPEVANLRITVIRTGEDGSESDVINPQLLAKTRKSFKVPIADNNLEPDESCIVRIRIQALTKGGTPILNACDDSDDFWIQPGEIPPPAEKERGKRLRHICEHYFQATYKTGKIFEARSQGWDAKRGNVYSIRLSNNERGDLVLNPLLLEVERFILANPNNLGALEVNAINRRRAELVDFKPIELSAAVNQFANDFYQARTALFSVIREQDQGNGVVAIANLHDHTDLVLAYVQSYLSMLEILTQTIQQASGPGSINALLHDYAAIMRIDTAFMRIGADSTPMEVVLLSPTHPLRMLWLFQFESFVSRWIEKMKGKNPAEIEHLLDQNSLERLVNLNIPNVISWSNGQVFINTDNIDLFWSILPNSDVSDLRTAVNAAMQLVGAAGQQVIISTVTPKQIADKLERYLCHHPYVRTLKLNVINPGDGMLLLEAIKQLLGKETYQGLNFDVKFFSPAGTRPQLVGNAFDDLMEQRNDQEWVSGRTVSEVEERLLSPNENPLFPKLIYAKHTITELLDDKGNRFDAHLSFIIDYFGTTVATRTHDSEIGSSSLHNLLAEYVTDYARGHSTATWSRMIAPSKCPDLASDGVTPQMYQNHDQLARLASCFFDWNKSMDKYSTVQLELTDAGGKNHLKMLRTVHEVSDWVFTIDRNFGIEYYDDPSKGPGSGESGGYLIDYTPEFLDAVSHRLIISTHHQHEIESILRSGFARLLFPGDEDESGSIKSYTVAKVLKVLKSVSGKLALKLINNPNQAQEVIGLALTRLALEKQGRLAGKVLIPVDSHLNLFYQTPKDLENGELSLKRTDLMLVELKGRKLHIDLIEVKNRSYSSPADQIELQNAIREKNTNSEKHFRANFLGSADNERFDAEIKNKELANILMFYYERACRYGQFDGQLLASDAHVNGADAANDFVKGLEAVIAGNCEMSFGHEGFIINGSATTGIDQTNVHDNEIYRIGRQGIQNLLELVVEDVEPEPGDTGGSKAEPAAGHAENRPETAAVISADDAPEFTDTDASPSTIAGGGVVADNASPAIPAKIIEDKSKKAASGVDQHTEQTKEINIYLGKNVVKGDDVCWNPHTTTPRRLTNQHILVVGKSGSGKSESTKALIYELAQQGVPTIIFDYQGEYAHGDFYDVVKPQVFNVMDGLPINPFELPVDPHTGKKVRPIEVVYSLADTLNTVFSGSGDIQLGILRESIKECYLQQGFDMQNDSTWNNVPPTLEMLSALLESWVADRGVQVKNLLVRLQPLFESGIFRQNQVAFSFDDLFTKTSVIRMTSGIKDLMLAASRFLLEKIYSAMLMKGMSKELRVMVCVDEAHKLCGDDTITSLIKEARKYGLGIILSSQETRDFHPSIFANTGTLICLALEDVDATKMSQHLGITDKNQQKMAKELILSQENGRALIRSQHFLPYAQVQVRSFEDRTK